jgi:hypothetical protein
MIRDVIAGLVGQAVLAAFLVAAFYGSLSTKLVAYDKMLDENAQTHKEIIASIDQINDKGTIRAQQAFSDVELLKKQMLDSALDRATMRTKLDYIIETQRELKMLMERFSTIQQAQVNKESPP